VKPSEWAPGRLPRVSVVVPTYGRHQVLIETLGRLLELSPAPDEIVVVDQTPSHPPEIEAALAALAGMGRIRRIAMQPPSIPAAMNAGLLAARGDLVLFVDDDVLPGGDLVAAHRDCFAAGDYRIIAGQVLQPGENAEPAALRGSFAFRSSLRREVSEVMGANFSVARPLALALGGFDQNFVGAAYRYEAEFCQRATAAGERILFEPRASLRHLRAAAGGTRQLGSHLTSCRPDHSVGEYYLLLRSTRGLACLQQVLARPLRAVATRHHLRRPWWIPLTLLGEARGLLWAARLAAAGPKLISAPASTGEPR